MASLHESHTDDLALVTGAEAAVATPQSCLPSPATSGSLPTSGSLQSYDAESLPSSCETSGSSRTCDTGPAAGGTAILSVPGVGVSSGFARPVTAGNVLQELRLVEVRVLEIASVLSRMDLDVGAVERGMLKRILDSIAASDGK